MEGHAGAGRLNPRMIDTDRTYSHILSRTSGQRCAEIGAKCGK